MKGNLLAASGRAGGRRVSEAERVDRPGPRSEPAQPVAYRLPGDRPRPPGCVERLLAEREEGRQRRGVRAPGAVGGAVGMPLAGDLDGSLPVEEEVGRLVAVPTRD